MTRNRAGQGEIMKESHSASIGEAKSILVIEDEEMVMDVAQAMIERMGFTVLRAVNGAEAVKIAGHHKGDIHLALLDMGLPDMDGEEVYALLRTSRPDMKILVCSGDAIYGIPKEILRDGAEKFIQKPYDYQSLSSKITETLE